MGFLVFSFQFPVPRPAKRPMCSPNKTTLTGLCSALLSCLVVGSDSSSGTKQLSSFNDPDFLKQVHGWTITYTPRPGESRVFHVTDSPGTGEVGERLWSDLAGHLRRNK